MASDVKAILHPYIYEDIAAVAQSDMIPWEQLRGKTLLLTGAAGFIGYYLTAALLIRNDLYQDDVTVIALVRNREKAEKRFGPLLKREDLKLIVQDVTDDIAIEEKADFIIHAASQASACFSSMTPSVQSMRT